MTKQDYFDMFQAIPINEDESNMAYCRRLAKVTRKSTAISFKKYYYKYLRECRGDETVNPGMHMTDTGRIYIENPVSATVDELLDKFDIDKDYWKVTKQVVNEWGSKDNYNRQCKAWLDRQGDIINWDKFKAEFLITIKKNIPQIPKKEYKKGKHCLEINIFDLHLGKIAWAPETGENYDHKIAEQRFFDAVNYFKKIADMFDIEEIVFPYGNDFFNSDKDYPYPQTTAGTPMENDLRWQKVFKKGREMIIAAVNSLSEIAPVKLIGVPGNHDVQKTFYLGDVLEVYYTNNTNVSVDNSPRLRKYYTYGKNLIGFTHGRSSDVPENRLLLLMPQEAPMLWAKSKYREWHCGDIHHSKKLSQKDEDHQGIVIRYMKALQGTDAWEYQKGYVGAIGGSESFIWDKEKGMIANFTYNL